MNNITDAQKKAQDSGIALIGQVRESVKAIKGIASAVSADLETAGIESFTSENCQDIQNDMRIITDAVQSVLMATPVLSILQSMNEVDNENTEEDDVRSGN